TARDSGNERRGDIGLELPRRDVIEQRDRPRSVHQNVVHAVVHEILAHRIVNPGPGGDQHLGPDAVGREDEDGALVPRRDANDPIAAPYTIARRRFGGERSPFLARWAMKPPANASPAPVGSNTSWSG